MLHLRCAALLPPSTPPPHPHLPLPRVDSPAARGQFASERISLEGTKTISYLRTLSPAPAEGIFRSSSHESGKFSPALPKWSRGERPQPVQALPSALLIGLKFRRSHSPDSTPRRSGPARPGAGKRAKVQYIYVNDDWPMSLVPVVVKSGQQVQPFSRPPTTRAPVAAPGETEEAGLQAVCSNEQEMRFTTSTT